MAKFVVTIEDDPNGGIAKIGFELDPESKKLLGEGKMPQTPAGVVFHKFLATFERKQVVKINGESRGIRGKGRKRQQGPRSKPEVYKGTEGRKLTKPNGEPLTS